MANPISSISTGQVLRLLDANANRAREALRVLEDYARFVLNDDAICGELKAIRHDLTAATKPWLNDAILFRDVTGDVGTGIKTEAELKRADLSEVVIAAGKRLGEALRSLEEYSKVVNATDAGKIEAIRYRFYSVEQAIERTLSVSTKFERVRLYVLITESACKRNWVDVAQEAINGGADCLQLREKDLESGELLSRAKKLVAMCHEKNVLCIINDRPDIAVLSNADGVHVGQGDLPAIEARKIIGREKIVGVSTHNIEQAKRAMTDGADYIGVGPVFRSPTKPRDFLPGLNFAAQVAKEIKIPSVAIAGINLSNVDEVLKTGMKRIAVTSAITGSDDVPDVTAELKRKVSTDSADYTD